MGAEGKALNVPRKDETMQAFVITAYKDYEALKTLTLALSRRGLCVIHADAQGAITARQVDELNALPNVARFVNIRSTGAASATSTRCSTCAAWRGMSAWITCT